MLTTSVIANRTRPIEMSSERRRPAASGKLWAISAAIVWLPDRSSDTISPPEDRTMATAIVSPRARPRPSMTADTMPEVPNGRTAMRIISQRVAPSASAASSCRRGVWRKTSRTSEVMIGRIMIDRTKLAVSRVRPVCEMAPSSSGAKIGIQPRYLANQA